MILFFKDFSYFCFQILILIFMSLEKFKGQALEAIELKQIKGGDENTFPTETQEEQERRIKDYLIAFHNANVATWQIGWGLVETAAHIYAESNTHYYPKP